MSDDTKQQIQQVLSEPQLAVLSTINDSNPWCRYVFISTDDDLTIRCATFENARKVAQIKQTNEVHLTCGIGSLTDIKPYLQIQATASISTSQDEKDSFWNPGLEEIFESKDDPSYSVIIIKPYRIEFCSQDKPIPEVWERDAT